MNSLADDYESLVAVLRDWGIRFLAPSDAKAISPLVPPEELIARLAEHPHPRLRLALVPLFILHPELAETLTTLTLPPSGEEILHKNYTAAACLQRMWSIRLGFYLHGKGILPDIYSSRLNLPPADENYGKTCLHALADNEIFNRISSYEGVMDLLFEQLKLEKNNEPAPTG